MKHPEKLTTITSLILYICPKILIWVLLIFVAGKFTLLELNLEIQLIKIYFQISVKWKTITCQKIRVAKVYEIVLVQTKISYNDII